MFSNPYEKQDEMKNRGADGNWSAKKEGGKRRQRLIVNLQFDQFPKEDKYKNPKRDAFCTDFFFVVSDSFHRHSWEFFPIEKLKIR